MNITMNMINTNHTDKMNINHTNNTNTFDCEYCKKSFVGKSTLKQHQKTAKFCLELQGSQSSHFECVYCKKSLSTNERLQSHLNICKSKELHDISDREERIKKEYEERLYQKELYYEEKLKEKAEYIAKLEARLEKFENTVSAIAAEPKNTKTTNIVVQNNMLNLTQEHVTKVLDEHLTKNIVAGGQKGLAQMVCEKILKGPDGKLMYKCVDPSRQNFEFINDDGDVERDIKAKKLTKALMNSNVQQKAAEVGNQLWTTEDGKVDSTMYNYCSAKVLEIACFEKDDSKFRSELSALTS